MLFDAEHLWLDRHGTLHCLAKRIWRIAECQSHVHPSFIALKSNKSPVIWDNHKAFAFMVVQMMWHLFIKQLLQLVNSESTSMKMASVVDFSMVVRDTGQVSPMGARNFLDEVRQKCAKQLNNLRSWDCLPIQTLVMVTTLEKQCTLGGNYGYWDKWLVYWPLS